MVTAQTADAIPAICLVCLSVMHTHCSDCHRAQITLFLNSFTASDLRYRFRFRNGRVRNPQGYSETFLHLDYPKGELSEDRPENYLLKWAAFCCCSKYRFC